MKKPELTRAENDLKNLLIKNHADMLARLYDETTHSVGEPLPGKLYIMVGLPGSGKTTYVKSALIDTVRVCHDDLYKMLTGVYKQELRELYHGIEDAIIINALVSGWDVAIDRTCLSKKTRERFIELGRQSGSEIIAIIIDTPIEISKLWNKNADRIEDNHFVNDEIFNKLVSEYDPVDSTEGFDNIFHINPSR